jgi:hypothetical protein
MECRHEADKAADQRDKAIVDAQVKLALRAQLITMLIVLSFVGLFALAVWYGQQLAGAAAAIAALATIIYALNGGRFWRRGSDNETPKPGSVG